MIEPPVSADIIKNRLFKGINPTQYFAETFNKSLNVEVTDANYVPGGDDADSLDGNISMTVKNSKKGLQPLQEDYTYIPPSKQTVSYQQIQQPVNTNSKLSKVIPQEILETIQKRGVEMEGSMSSMNNQTTNFIEKNVRKDLMGIPQPKVAPIVTEQYQPQGNNDEALAKLAESVNMLTKLITLKENNSNIKNNTISLIIEGTKYNGIIKQTKKGDIIFIIDEENCIILKPDKITKYKT